MTTLLAKHAQGKGGPDTIFAYSAQATARAKEVGKENITNATVGAFLNADGSLKTMQTVQDALAAVPFDEGANYAPINGLPEYIDAMTESVSARPPASAYLYRRHCHPRRHRRAPQRFFNYLNEAKSPSPPAITGEIIAACSLKLAATSKPSTPSPQTVILISPPAKQPARKWRRARPTSCSSSTPSP